MEIIWGKHLLAKQGKTTEEIFTENNYEALTNTLKLFHLDGGGKITYFKDEARKIAEMFGVNDDSATDKVADYLYNRDRERMVNLRKSAIHRITLVKERLENPQLTLTQYMTILIKKLRDTTNHSTKLNPCDIQPK